MTRKRRNILSSDAQKTQRTRTRPSERKGTLSSQGVARPRKQRSGRRGTAERVKKPRVSRRLLRLVGTAALSLAAGAALMVTLTVGRKSAADNALFRLHRIEVSGLGRATREEIVALAGIEAGHSLLSIDPARVERAVLRHPWVARAHVERRWPRTVAIELREHQPVALVALGSLYYVDGDAEIVKRHAPGESEVFPVITGLTREEIEGGDGAAQARLRSAVSFLQELRAIGGDGAPAIAEVHLEPGGGLSYVAAGEEVRVHLPRPPWREALQRLELARTALAERQLVATEIAVGGVQRPERIVARLAGTGGRSGQSGNGQGDNGR